jgi:hypothetical protein
LGAAAQEVACVEGAGGGVEVEDGLDEAEVEPTHGADAEEGGGDGEGDGGPSARGAQALGVDISAAHGVAVDGGEGAQGRDGLGAGGGLAREGGGRGGGEGV